MKNIVTYNQTIKKVLHIYIRNYIEFLSFKELIDIFLFVVFTFVYLKVCPRTTAMFTLDKKIIRDVRR